MYGRLQPYLCNVLLRQKKKKTFLPYQEHFPPTQPTYSSTHCTTCTQADDNGNDQDERKKSIIYWHCCSTGYHRRRKANIPTHKKNYLSIIISSFRSLEILPCLLFILRIPSMVFFFFRCCCPFFLSSFALQPGPGRFKIKLVALSVRNCSWRDKIWWGPSSSSHLANTVVAHF